MLIDIWLYTVIYLWIGKVFLFWYKKIIAIEAYYVDRASSVVIVLFWPFLGIYAIWVATIESLFGE